MYRLLVLILFLLKLESAFSQQHFSIGVNCGIEPFKIYVNGSEYSFYSNIVRSKNSIEVNYHNNVISIGTGLSLFEDSYYYYPGTRYGEEMDFYFDYFSIPINFSVDVEEKPNTLFASLNYELVYSGFSQKVGGFHGTFYDTLNVNGTKFSHVNMQIGLGYKIKVIDEFYVKLFSYYSMNLSDKNILDDKNRFNKFGFQLGVFYKF